jgi:hypothetical protein
MENMETLSVWEMADDIGLVLDMQDAKAVNQCLICLAHKNNDTVPRKRRKSKDSSGHSQSYLVSSFPPSYISHFENLTKALAIW